MKLYDWMKGHKFITGLICFIIFILQALAVHALHKCNIGIPWFSKIWEPGDFLAYVSGFEAFLGTVFLGLVSLNQSKKADAANMRLSEENNYFQKVMSQKLMPIVKLCSVKTTGAVKNYRNPEYLPSANGFTKFTTFNTGSPEEATTVICVNIDVEEETPAYCEELSFSISNISEAIIRHICVDDITICGYEGVFSEIRCSNVNPQNGISSLFAANDLLKVQMLFYFNSEEIKSRWNSELGGLAISMFLTNTTITGIRFQEFVDIRVGNNGYLRISYGEGAFREGGKDNA